MKQKVRIIKEGKGRDCYTSIDFFKKHYHELGKITHVVFYYAEHEWAIYRKNPDMYHQFTIFIGEKAQLWTSGFTWGYCGAGPGALHDVLLLIDPSISYDEITHLEWEARIPIMLQNVQGRLIEMPFSEEARALISSHEGFLPWEDRRMEFPECFFNNLGF